MIRFIDLGFQIEDDIRHFAFWDTITDSFLLFGNKEITQTFINANDFELSVSSQSLMERCKSLIPKDWPDTQLPGTGE